MPVDLARLKEESPYLYHVTYAASLERIRRLRRLESAAALLAAGGRGHLIRTRREAMEVFHVDADTIRLTDQLPLIEANIAFEGGWLLADLIEAVNRRVFFWRGPADGLLAKDRGHFGKYDGAGHPLVFLRMGLDETARENAERGPEVCKYNSGAARMNDGKPIPRGPSTFVRPEDATFGVGSVREVVFQEYVLLPASAELCDGSWKGPWRRVWPDAGRATHPDPSERAGG